MNLNSTLKIGVARTKEGSNLTKSITIYIDNLPYQVDEEDNLLSNVLSQKLNLPYFCWHPSMGSVGACRQCAVTQYMDENDSRGRVIMSCMTPVVDGMRIGLSDDSSSEFREQVVSAMMTNHPHDCPVCAEGGECHLQDMTVMTGHSARSYQGTKRTFTNQYLGELVGHEMNRCITCYRCVRFYKDYAGGEDFGVYGSKNQVYFGRQSDGALESEFSGNLVEVCPTGVFTNKVFSSHYTRKWDLQSSPSICAHCSIGCNTSIGERYGSVRRVTNRFNADINGYFLCDRGRYGLGFVNGNQRVTQAKGISQASSEQLKSLDVQKALAHFRGKKFIGIGSARASLETNAYLKVIVGDAAFSCGFTEEYMALSSLHLAHVKQFENASIKEVEQSDFVLIVGEDITQTSPRLSLAVRQALRNKSFEKAKAIGIPKWQDDAVRTCGGKELTPLYSLNSVETKLDKVSKKVFRQTPQRIMHLIQALSQMLDLKLLEKPEQSGELFAQLSEEEQLLLAVLCKDLIAAKAPLIVSGWSLSMPELIASITKLMQKTSALLNNTSANEATTSSAVRLKCTVLPPEVNTIGLISLLDSSTLSIEGVISALENDDCDGLIVVENALEGLSLQQKEKLKQAAKLLIVLDHSHHIFAEQADILLPVATVSESSGCYVNYQGEIQQFHQSCLPKLPIMESWRWLTYFDGLINKASSKPFTNRIQALTNLRVSLSDSFQQFDLSALEQGTGVIARETKRASGRTAKTANLSVHEPKSTEVKEGKFKFSMEGKPGTADAEIPFVWAPGWNSNQAVTQFQQQVGGELEEKISRLFIDLSSLNDIPMKNNVSNNSPKPIKSADEAAPRPSEKISTTVLTKTPWYRGEWQSNLNPEFTLLHTENTCTVSPKVALAKVWSHGQLLKFTFSHLTCFARIVIDNHRENKNYLIDENIICLDCTEYTKHVEHDSIELALASPDEEKQFVLANESRFAVAKINKEEVLRRLQERDQYIPIRLHAGGLNDA